jgi:hypothetical protein
VPNNTNLQVKTEANPPSPPPPQIQEPQQQNDSFPTHGIILTITTDFNTKWQRRDYYREVNHVVIKGPITQTRWSHIPVTFSAQDANLASFPQTNAMVLTVHIDRWDVSRILIINGSQAKILFMSAFEKMGYNKKRLKEPMEPLYRFGDKRIEPVGVITLPISFGLTGTFTNMCEAKLKLNSDKCVFRVTQGKVFGCLVSTKGIEASLDKIKTIL